LQISPMRMSALQARLGDSIFEYSIFENSNIGVSICFLRFGHAGGSMRWFHQPCHWTASRSPRAEHRRECRCGRAAGRRWLLIYHPETLAELGDGGWGTCAGLLTIAVIAAGAGIPAIPPKSCGTFTHFFMRDEGSKGHSECMFQNTLF